MVVKTQNKKIKRTKLQADVYNLLGKIIGKVELPEKIFAAKENNILVAQAVRVYQTNQRLGTRKAKTRAEVSYTTKKMYRQKGTGRARHGSKKAPIFVGGGVAHGPHQYKYNLSISKKMKKQALFAVLTDKLKSGDIKIISSFEKLEPKTKQAIDFFSKFNLTDKSKKLIKNTLLITSNYLEKLNFATRNIYKLQVIPVNVLNVYQILSSGQVFFDKDAIEKLGNLQKISDKNEKNPNEKTIKKISQSRKKK